MFSHFLDYLKIMIFEIVHEAHYFDTASPASNHLWKHWKSLNLYSLEYFAGMPFSKFETRRHSRRLKRWRWWWRRWCCWIKRISSTINLMLFQMRALFATTAVESCGINEKKLKKKTETLHNSKNMDCNNKPKGSSTEKNSKEYETYTKGHRYLKG